MKMNYQSGDKLKNRYLSNDAFTSLTNKLGGRSIISLGNRRKKNSYRVANQGLSLFDYKSIIYKSFVIILLLIMCIYIIPQTRYFVHGHAAKNLSPESENAELNNNFVSANSYNVAPVFLKTDQFISKQKEGYVADGMQVYDYFTNNILGVTIGNSSSTVRIKLFSDAGFKNNFLIEQDAIAVPQNIPADPATSTLTSSTTQETATEIIKEMDHAYQSYVFEGLGYGQLIAKVPPKTVIKKDSYVYVRTEDGLKPFAKIINVDEDNKSTFTIVYAQLVVSPQNLYKVILK